MKKAILTNKRVLVTGGAGFIGSNIIDKLIKQDNEIVCVDNLATGKIENISEYLKLNNFEFVEGDIRNFETCKKAVKNIDVILHQAALGSVPRSINDPKTTNDVNIGGFINMLVAAKEQGVKRFVYAASSSTYGDNKDLPKIEDNIGKPLSPYAITKYVNELYAEIFSKLYGLETIGLRYFNVFGRRQDPYGAYAAVFPLFIKLLLKGEAPIINGDGNQSRDFTYIDNVIQANELAATTQNQKALNTVFNIAYGESNSLNNLTQELIAQLTKFKPEVSKIKPLHGPERQGDIKHSLASINKAKELLGYNPKYDVHKGLEQAIEWYYKNLK
ncbi:MAG: SDR family oxidoreductase [Bacteroidales bacterium]|jgi:UDP-N-acetylglucosamine 4-epimerase|nr:SDR family oxidoreductase [Bacteroidales bacterium]MDD4235355.1 SDR family oxidoreductase [Bacteroidales bacterium]MDY0161080.1 SDR family oxidoreductase [Bacteroidales bacterium]